MTMVLMWFFLWMLLGLVGFSATALFVMLTHIFVLEYRLRRQWTPGLRILLVEVLVMGCVGVLVLKGLWILVVLACAILVGLTPESLFQSTFERYYHRRFLWHKRLPRGRFLFEAPSEQNVSQSQPSLSHHERE